MPFQTPPPIVHDAVVAAPIEAVWDAWTTQEGVTSFFAPAARVERRVGGAYEMYFLVTGPPGERGGEGLHFLELEPPRRFLIEWNAPPHFGPLRGQKTWVEVTLAEAEGKTAVHLVHGGFGDVALGWTAVHDYFVAAWGRVLANLVQRFASGPIDWASRLGPEAFAAATAIQAEANRSRI